MQSSVGQEANRSEAELGPEDALCTFSASAKMELSK